MPDSNAVQRKPRLWLRLLLVLIGLGAITGSLAYVKFLQIQEQIAMGSQAPPPISVTVATAEEAEWNRRLRAIGTLVPFLGVDITTEVSGIVKSIEFESGDEIEANALLVELDDRTERANLESAQARFESDNSQYQRLLKLRDQSFVTKNDIDTQASLADIAKAQVVVAQTALAKKRIYAPFSGKLGINQVDIGEYITPGQNIVTLLSLDRLYLDFTLPEDNFNDLEVKQEITFRVRPYPDIEFKARVETWSPELDADTRNIKVRAIFDNRKRLLAPGMFADMELRSRRKIPVLAIPETSIFYNIYGEAVYVVETPAEDDAETGTNLRLAARQVKVAYRENGFAGIVGGISAGDRVVTSGQLKLYPGLRVTVVDDVPEYSPAAEKN